MISAATLLGAELPLDHDHAPALIDSPLRLLIINTDPFSKAGQSACAPQRLNYPARTRQGGGGGGGGGGESSASDKVKIYTSALKIILASCSTTTECVRKEVWSR